MRSQAWESDKLKDDWELERTVDGGRGVRRTIHLQGAGGIVNSLVASVLGDLMQPLPPCSASECHELSDDAALEVPNATCILSLCVYICTNTSMCVNWHFFFPVGGGDCKVLVNCIWQAMPVPCSPVDLLQLLQPAVYPESDAVTVVAQARARVFIYLKTLTRARIDVAARRVAASPHPPSSPPLSSLLARICAAMLRRESWGQMSVTRRMTLLALLLLAAIALLKLSRGSILRAVRLLLRYSRR